MTCPNCQPGCPCPDCLSEAVAIPRVPAKRGPKFKPVADKLVPLCVLVHPSFKRFMELKKGNRSRGAWLQHKAGFQKPDPSDE